MPQTVTFEIDQLGTFTARTELTMLEEQQVEFDLDRVLDGRHEELLGRVRELYREEREEARREAEDILNQIETCRAIITMERLLVTRPDTVGPMQEITGEGQFKRIHEAYREAVSDSPTRRRRSILNYLSDLAAAEEDEDADERARDFEHRETAVKRNDLLYWFRKKYGLAITDYRVRDLTYSQALEEYLEHILETRAQSMHHRREPAERPAGHEDGFRSWAAQVKQDPAYFEQWAKDMERKVAQQLGKPRDGKATPASTP